MDTTVKKLRDWEVSLLKREIAITRIEKDLKNRENIIETVEKYMREREAALKEKLAEQGMSIVKDEDAVFFME
jgi:hypothetical protein